MTAPATVSVFDNVYSENATAVVGATVTCYLNSAVEATSGGLISPLLQETTTTDVNGRFAFTLVPNDLMIPAGSTYTIVTPFRVYSIAPQSGNGASQQSTAANVLVNAPGAVSSIINGPADLAIRSLTVLANSPYAPSAAAGTINDEAWMPPALGGATDQYAVLQAVLTANPSRIIRFWDGTYRTSQPLIPAAGQQIRGMGMGNTIITLVPSTDYTNFNNNFIFTGPGASWLAADVSITDLTIDLQSRNSTAPAHTAGGISFGSRTIAERVHVDDSNWYAWRFVSGGTVSSKMIDCVSSRGSTPLTAGDNISGGLGVSDIEIVRHRWNANLSANSVLDFVPADNIKVTGCTNLSIYALILEACTNCQIDGNIFNGVDNIVLQSDQSYAFPAGVTNCRNITVSNNVLLNNVNDAVVVRFASGGAATVKGQGIVIEDNLIINPQWHGVSWLNETSTTSAGGNVIRNNTIINPNAANLQVAHLTGLGTSDGISGIFLGNEGVSTVVKGNSLLDTRAATGGATQMRHGIQYGRTDTGPFAASFIAGTDNYIGLTTSTPVYIGAAMSGAPTARTVQNFTGVTGATVPDPNLGETIFWLLSGNVTVSAVVAPLNGQLMTLMVQQDGTGGRTFTWNAQYDTNWQPSPMANSRSTITLQYELTRSAWTLISASAVDQTGTLALTGRVVSLGATAPTTTNKGANVTSVTFTGNDLRGAIVIVMAGVLAANTRIATCTWAASFLNFTPLPMLVNQTSGVGLANVGFYSGAESVTAFDLFSNQALAAGTYTLRYWNVD